MTFPNCLDPNYKLSNLNSVFHQDPTVWNLACNLCKLRMYSSSFQGHRIVLTGLWNSMVISSVSIMILTNIVSFRMSISGSTSCHCYALGCSNRDNQSLLWKQAQCSVHGCLHDEDRCSCSPPFELFTFPTIKKIHENRQVINNNLILKYYIFFWQITTPFWSVTFGYTHFGNQYISKILVKC